MHLESIILAELYVLKAGEVQRWWWSYKFDETYIIVFWDFNFVLDQIYSDQGSADG